MSELLLHGAKLDSQRLRETLLRVFRTNVRLQEDGRRANPVCIWGTHGIGKTMLVEDIAQENGWQFSYCAPAQFEHDAVAPSTVATRER